jgi:hypothetical protein
MSATAAKAATIERISFPPEFSACFRRVAGRKAQRSFLSHGVGQRRASRRRTSEPVAPTPPDWRSVASRHMFCVHCWRKPIYTWRSASLDARAHAVDRETLLFEMGHAVTLRRLDTR